MRSYVLVTALVSLMACTIFAAPSRQPKKAAKPVKSIKQDPAKEIYKAYLQAKELAPKIQSQILNSPELADKLAVYENRKMIGVRKIVEESTSTVRSPEMEYLLQHFDDFIIDWNEGLFCSPNLPKFLKGIEKLKPSDESWALRKDYLSSFKDINMPWCEDCFGHNITSLMDALKETQDQYGRGKYRPLMAKWIDGFVMRLESEIRNYRRNDDASLNKVKDSRVATMRNWIQQLREMK